MEKPNNPKEDRIKVATDTVHISRANGYSYKGKSITLDSRLHSYPITIPENFTLPNVKRNGKIEVISSTTIAAIIDNKDISESLGVLNFASAHTIGGGFLTGAMAQEESLCYCSNLYVSQLTQENMYYAINRKSKSKTYTDEMFNTKYVSVFKNDKFDLLESPIVVGNMITCPAVNVSSFEQMTKNEEQMIHLTMLRRIHKTIVAFIQSGATTLILGAFGCGVFGNNPFDVAQYFKQLLILDGYAKYFDKIIFAIPNRPEVNLSAFKSVFCTDVKQEETKQEVKIGECGLELLHLYQNTLGISEKEARQILFKNKRAVALLSEELALRVHDINMSLGILLKVTLLRDLRDVSPINEKERALVLEYYGLELGK